LLPHPECPVHHYQGQKRDCLRIYEYTPLSPHQSTVGIGGLAGDERLLHVGVAWARAALHRARRARHGRRDGVQCVIGRLHITDDDVTAVLGQPLRERLADAVGRAGNNGNLVLVAFAHSTLPLGGLFIRQTEKHVRSFLKAGFRRGNPHIRPSDATGYHHSQ